MCYALSALVVICITSHVSIVAGCVNGVWKIGVVVIGGSCDAVDIRYMRG